MQQRLQNTEQSISFDDDLDSKDELKQEEKQRKVGEGKKKSKNANNLVVNIGDTRYPIVKRVVKVLLKFKTIKDLKSQEWDLMWTDNAVQPQQLAKMKPHQKINHFPGMYSLSRKNYLARNLTKMSKQFPTEYNFYPKTWVLPSEYNQLRVFMQTENNPIVIAKPQASCQGRGIFLSKSIEDFEFGSHYVVQKYMKRPFLIDGLKFDLRIYVLVAGCDPLRIYIYHEGLARFATQPYCSPKKENLQNLFMHLTNYAINKASSKFEYNQSDTQMDTGHKRSLSSIFKKLQQLGHNSQEIWNEICDLINKTVISVQPVLSHHYRTCQPENYSNNMCFEILGFDVILENNLKPVILEVNYTPSFTIDTPLDKLIKESLIRDTLILLNLSSKVKNDTVNQKKRQMMQRTLTGKKVWYSKQQRDKLIQFHQAKRDQWQNVHLGNFQKIFPSKDVAKMVEYNKYLQYSQHCYLNVTGANIKRNEKVVTHTSNLHVAITEDSTDKPKIARFTKTDQLQRIYIKKIKPMTTKKLKSVSIIKKQMTQSTKIKKQEQEEEKNFERTNGVYQSIDRINLQKTHNKVACLTDKAIAFSRSNQSENHTIIPKKSAVSKVYNIAFRQMKYK